jgi:hypothetical protein
MTFRSPQLGRAAIARFLLVLVATTATLLVGTAVPAQAAIYWCEETGGRPNERCWVGYQQFPYGQTTGLRSSMQGYADGPNFGVLGSQLAGVDEILVKLRVWDLKEDGYRARVWVDIFKGCLCVTDSYKVRSGPYENQYAGAVVDGYRADVPAEGGWDYANAETGATEGYYTVRLRLGRYKGSSNGAVYEWGEEQRYYLTLT